MTLEIRYFDIAPNKATVRRRKERVKRKMVKLAELGDGRSMASMTLGTCNIGLHGLHEV